MLGNSGDHKTVPMLKNSQISKPASGVQMLMSQKRRSERQHPVQHGRVWGAVQGRPSEEVKRGLMLEG